MKTAQIKLKNSFTPYPEYRDSGIEWIGKIPKGWGVDRLKRLFFFQSGDGFPNKLQGNKTGDIPFMKVSDINGEKRFIEESNNYVDAKTVRENSWHLVPKDSILMAKIGAALAKNHRKVNTVPVCIDNNMIAAIPRRVIPAYAYWIWKSLNMVDFENISSVPSINLTLLKDFTFPVPVTEQQKKIAKYLDEKTALIDQIIEKKKKLIELLREKRTAVINNAVTKGLRSDVELVDSGIEWIGKMPKGWRLRKMKHIARVQASNIDKLTDPNFPSVLLCNYVDVYKNEYIDSTLNFMPSTATLEQIKKVGLRKNDVLLTKDSETANDIGIPAVVKENVENLVSGYHLYVARPEEKDMNGGFLFRYLQSRFVRSYFETSANGVTRFGLGSMAVKDTLVLVPDLDEQRRIFQYVNEKAGLSDLVIQRVENSIETLKEFKSSLISNVVTGKIKV